MPDKGIVQTSEGKKEFRTPSLEEIFSGKRQEVPDSPPDMFPSFMSPSPTTAQTETEDPGTIEEIFERAPSAKGGPPEGFEFTDIPTRYELLKRKHQKELKSIRSDIDKVIDAAGERKLRPKQFNNAIRQIVEKNIDKIPNLDFISKYTTREIHKRMIYDKDMQRGWFGNFVVKSWDEMSEQIQKDWPMIPALMKDIELALDPIRESIAGIAEDSIKIATEITRDVVADPDFAKQRETAIRDAKFGTLKLISGFTKEDFMSTDARRFIADAMKDPGAGREFVGNLMEGTGFIGNMALLGKFTPQGKAGKIKRIVQRGMTAGLADYLRGSDMDQVAQTTAFWTAMGFTGEGLLAAARLPKNAFIKLVPREAQAVAGAVYDKFKRLAPKKFVDALNKIGPGVIEFGRERTYDIGESINDALAWATMISKNSDEFVDNAIGMFVSSVVVNMGTEMALDGILRGAELPLSMREALVKKGAKNWVDRNNELYDEVEREAIKAAIDQQKVDKESTIKGTLDTALKLKKPKPKMMKVAEKPDIEDFGLSPDQRSFIERQVAELGSFTEVKEQYTESDAISKYAVQIAERFYPAEAQRAAEGFAGDEARVEEEMRIITVPQNINVVDTEGKSVIIEKGKDYDVVENEDFMRVIPLVEGKSFYTNGFNVSKEEFSKIEEVSAIKRPEEPAAPQEPAAPPTPAEPESRVISEMPERAQIIADLERTGTSRYEGGSVKIVQDPENADKFTVETVIAGERLAPIGSYDTIEAAREAAADRLEEIPGAIRAEIDKAETEFINVAREEGIDDPAEKLLMIQNEGTRKGLSDNKYLDLVRNAIKNARLGKGPKKKPKRKKKEEPKPKRVSPGLGSVKEKQTQMDGIAKTLYNRTFIKCTKKQKEKVLDQYESDNTEKLEGKWLLRYELEYSKDNVKAVKKGNPVTLLMRKMKSQGMMLGWVKKEFTDGKFLILDEAENQKLQGKFREKMIEALAKENMKKGMTPVDAQKEATDKYNLTLEKAKAPATEKVIPPDDITRYELFPQLVSIGAEPEVDYVLLSTGERQTRINASMYRYFTGAFKDVKFYEWKRKKEKIDVNQIKQMPLLVYSGDKRVAIIMPIVNSRNENPVFSVGPGFVPEGVTPPKVSMGSKTAGEYSPPIKDNPRITGVSSESSKYIFELPEMLELGKMLMQGRLPRVMKRLRRGPGGTYTLGRFRAMTGDLGTSMIELSADIFRTPGQAAKTLAHEIGHLIDFIPQAMLKRGNIFGHIASLKRYTKSMIDAIPTDPSLVITNKERSRISSRARSEAKKKFPKEDQQEERKEYQKKLYREEIDRIIAERGLITKDIVQEELKELSMWWKPFSEEASLKFKKYRYSPAELYADAFSVLLNNPGALADMAPKYTTIFFNYLERKPEAKKAYDSITDQIASGEYRKQRVIRRREGYRKGDDKYAVKLKTDIRWNDAFRTSFIDAHSVLLSLVKRVGERNVPPAENPRYAIEDMQYSGSENEFYVKQVYNDVITVYESQGLDAETFGEFLEMLRIMTDRKDIANPGGIGYEEALARFAEMKQTFSEEQWTALREAQQNYWSIRQEVVIEPMEKAGMWSEDLMKKINDNEFYAFFDVVKHISEKYGPVASPKIYKQIGTFEDIANPFTATLMKDLSLINSVNRNNAKKSSVAFLLKNYGEDQIKPARTRFVSAARPKELVDPTEKGKGLLVVMDKGEAKGFYVDEYVADAFENKSSNEGAVIAQGLSYMTQPFRTLFIELNPGFQLFNLHRDFFADIYALPGANIRNFLPIWLSSFKPAYRSAFKIPDAVVDEMLKKKMLISVANFRGMRSEDKELERTLRKFHVDRKTWLKRVQTPFGKLLNHVSSIRDVMENFNQIGERTSKIAAYRFLKKHYPDMSQQEVSHIVRIAGSPAFLRKGTLYPVYNNLVLFSNAVKEGYRASGEIYSRNPSEFATKYVSYVLLPKVLMWMAKYGFMGYWAHKIYNRVSSYDLSNYHILPIGETADGNRAVYWRLPMDETSRLLGGLTWKILDEFGGRAVDPKPRAPVSRTLQDLFDYMAGQAPTLNPLLKLGWSTIDYCAGQNPYDNFRQRHAVPERVFEAGGMRSHKAFAAWLARNSGMSLVYNFKSNDERGVKSELEKILSYPFILNNITGRFIKFTNYGEVERLREVKNIVKTQNARDILDAKKAMKKMLDGEQLSVEDLQAMMKKEAMLDRNIITLLGRRWGNAFISEYLNARTKAERFAVIQEKLRQNNYFKD